MFEFEKKSQHLGKRLKINFAMWLIEYCVLFVEITNELTFGLFQRLLGNLFFSETWILSSVIQMQMQYFRATNGLVGHYSSCTVRL